MAIFVVYTLLFFVIGTSIGNEEFISINAPGDVPDETPLEDVAKRGKGGSKLSKMLARTGEESMFGGGGYTIREQKLLLRAHNQDRKRVSPSASDIHELVWSRDLADMAQAWSDNCIYEHPDRTVHLEFNGIGQNLYIKYNDRNGDSPPTPTAQPVTLWYSEDKDYRYEIGSCDEGKVCGHYTQVVWAKTTDVGCGMAWCDEAVTNSGQSFEDAWLVTCNYSPGGNYRGQKPYKSGRPCAECPNGFCKDGLCSDCDSSDPDCVCMLDCQHCGTRDDQACTCSCQPGFHGVACEETCGDTHRYCGSNPGWPTSWCNQPRFPFVDLYCPKMCGQCVGAEEGVECTE